MPRKPMSERMDELIARFDEIEELLTSGATASAAAIAQTGGQLYCSVPETRPRDFGPEVSEERIHAIQIHGKKWVNKTKLHFYFFKDDSLGAGDDQKEQVRKAFKKWKAVGIGLDFVEVSSPAAAEVRIGFLQGDGSWSYVGRDALMPSLRGKRTMNFGWDVTVDGPNGLDTAIHEVGHAIGFEHEHQNPKAGIVWNEPAVLDHFAGSPNFWTDSKIRHNILKKIPSHSIEGSDWDVNSIMHYAFGAGLIDVPTKYRTEALIPEAGLSEHDQQVVRKFYPDPDADGDGQGQPSKLVPFKSQVLSISAGEQKDFRIEPAETRKYVIQTFGPADTVMVLFEDNDGEFIFTAGDDDSGVDRNARIEARLIRGRRYEVRIRLQFVSSDGDLAVMMT